MAHDFNDLLTVISGHTDLSLKQLQPENPIYESLAEIHTAAERAAALARQLPAINSRRTPCRTAAPQARP